MSMIDIEIMRIAERRRNLVTRSQLETLGLSIKQIDNRLHDGRLHRVLRRVYSTVEPPLPLEVRRLALCLAIPGGVISHTAAATYWRLRGVPRDRLELTISSKRGVANTTAVIHRTNLMPAHHIVRLLDGLRLTSPARTLFDLGGLLDLETHLSAVDDAYQRELTTPQELREVYDELAGRGRRGSAALRDALAEIPPQARPTMSAYELRLARALIASGLPEPTRQHVVRLLDGTFVRIDLAYPDRRLAIEVDHTHWHAGLAATARDKARDVQLARVSWETLRVTDDDLDRRLGYVVGSVRDIYARRAAG
jgi:very-short-patch-repair endonuclease